MNQNLNLKSKKNLILVLSFLSLLVMAIPLNSSAVSLTPSSASTLIGVSATYTATGVSTADTYLVELDGTEVVSDINPTSAGVVTFTVSSAVAGTFLVQLCYANGSSVASATLIVTDLFATVMPYMVLLVGFTILFGVIKELKF